MNATMISVPLPILTALLCAIIAPLMLRLDLGRRAAAVIFALTFLEFAVQSALVGLRFGYGVERFIHLQRILPLSVGPLLYLGFLSLAVSPRHLRRLLLLHLGVALAVAVLLVALADIYRDYDAVISLSYILYGLLLFRLARQGPDRLIHARLDVAPLAVRWMFLVIGLLGFLLTLDTAIAVSFALAQGKSAPALIAFGSATIIAALLLILIRLPSRLSAQGNRPDQPPAGPDDAENALEAKARELLERSQLYLDPDLTVQRIARRLSVPERALSAAINQSQGMNVSQYVNRFRLEHAARLLRETEDPVTRIMASSGFLTRSNFYREFQRVYGQTPASYRSNK